MDLDDLPRKQPTAAEALAKESLDDLSVYELKERIALLEAEIERTRSVVKTKESGQSDAEKLFR